ncbi:hypothetical protein C6P45_000411 [Maudiozyma exigua]|uniref:Uncharacterized protein n=1 Tax=Maudiozyma exigua TaxID=34358 RepID=A0A9P7B8E2_MAUEX|nr:hypothetical protein C6P45_000411 [Kazachstania exigua]
MVTGASKQVITRTKASAMSNSDRKRRSHDEAEGRGLRTELHPALKSSNLTLIKEQQHSENPYLSGNQNDKTLNKRRHLSHFYQKGEILSRVNKEREQFHKIEAALKIETEREQESRKEYQLKVDSGELPDLTKEEDKLLKKIEDIPDDVEWWDKVYLDKDDPMKILVKYTIQDYNSDDDNEYDDEMYAPSIRYVHHPLLSSDSLNKIDHLSRMYLTKKEYRKIRRHKRKMNQEEKETKIKLGVISKPEPKVKLSNMMNVLENDSNITDPTRYENMVKEQVKERKEKHLEVNQLRHKEAVERKKEAESVYVPMDRSQLYYCNVYKFKNLVNPQIRYKLNMNAKQLKLRGCCIRLSDDGPGVIISVTNEKNSKFFNKLVMNRLKWADSFQDRKTNETIDNSNNSIKSMWAGTITLQDHPFSNWFMRVCQDKEEMKTVLKRFNAESFLRDLAI